MIFVEWITHFWERFAGIMSESLMSLFLTEQQEWFDHGRSFVKSNKWDSLMVTHIKEQQE